MHRFVAFMLFNPEENAQDRNERNRIFNELKLYRRTLRDYGDPFILPPEFFRKYYRMYPAMVRDLAQILQPHILAQGYSEIDPTRQVLAALRFFAEGGIQKGISQEFWHPLGQPTLCRILNRVVISLCNIANDWIRFPSTREERENESQRFLPLNPIRGIIGLIDCFVVKLIRPPDNEEAFYNHKHGHSFNVQVVCGQDFIIHDIRICPGSNNDRYIWKFSEIRHYLRSLRQNDDVLCNEGLYYLLGDSGYTPSPILLTPIRNVEIGTPAAQYTADHCATRCIVERTFADLTNKYLAISRRRVLHYRPRKAAQIILATAVLHNYQKYNGQRPNGIENIGHVGENVLPIDEVAEYQEGLLERQRLIDLYYPL